MTNVIKGMTYESLFWECPPLSKPIAARRLFESRYLTKNIPAFLDASDMIVLKSLSGRFTGKGQGLKHEPFTDSSSSTCRRFQGLSDVCCTNLADKMEDAADKLAAGSHALLKKVAWSANTF